MDALAVSYHARDGRDAARAIYDALTASLGWWLPVAPPPGFYGTDYPDPWGDHEE